MSSAPKILAFAGSTREGSFNRKLLELAVKGARAAGAEVTVVDLREYRLPLMDEDLEKTSGIPEPARRLKQLFVEHDGLLIASPEYNSSITPLTKNTIDWVSRSLPGESPLSAFVGKTAAIISASPGALGGLRGLVTLRSILSNIQVIVLPDTISVPAAHEAFNADGTLKDAKKQATVDSIGRRLTETIAKFKGS
jgi:NAD(P)H-dependent FMN reductase